MPDEVPMMPSSSADSAPAAGMDAAAQARAAFENFRQQHSFPRGETWGQPGFSYGPQPPMGGQVGPFPLPPAPGMEHPPAPGPSAQTQPPGQGQPEPSLLRSVGTMLRLGVDLINSGLQGLAAVGEPGGGQHGYAGYGEEHSGCGCEGHGDFEPQGCGGCYYATPRGCCMPSVRNCF